MCEVIDEGSRNHSFLVKKFEIIREGKYPSPQEIEQIEGSAFLGPPERYGKFIRMFLGRGNLFCHNAMSGYWDWEDDPWTFDYVEGKRQPTDDDVRVIITLNDPLTTRRLRYHDARLFGSIRYFDTDRIPPRDLLGPEALATKYTPDHRPEIQFHEFYQGLMKSKQPVKAYLLDQSKISGIGNIYAAEALWEAGVSPKRTANSLDPLEARVLYDAFRHVLHKAIERKLDYSGLKIYRKDVCERCDLPVLAEDIKGRTSWFCGGCQK